MQIERRHQDGVYFDKRGKWRAYDRKKLSRKKGKDTNTLLLIAHSIRSLFGKTLILIVNDTNSELAMTGINMAMYEACPTQCTYI